ncbi:MAG: prephenate dehydrogenase/arogenate dehydrogenase family protein [Thermoprotei archaeon]
MMQKLRDELDATDEQIARLIGKRLQLARQIGEIKYSSQASIIDQTRENEVARHWKELGAKYDIPYIESIARDLITASRAVQLRARQAKKVAIIGDGKMGRLLQGQFNEVGHRTRRFEPSRVNGIEWAEIVVLAVPQNGVLDLMRSLQAGLKGKIVMDIASDKSRIFHEAEKIALDNGFNYVGVHPLFNVIEGPFTERVVIIPSSADGGRAREVEEFWSSAGFQTQIADIDEHERGMSVAQVMVHFYLQALAYSLKEYSAELGVNLTDFETRTLRRVMEIIKDVDANDQVIKEIRRENPFSASAVASSLSNMKRIAEGDLVDDIHAEKRPRRF